MKKLIFMSLSIFLFGVMSYSQTETKSVSPKRAKIEANLIEACRAVGLTSDAQIAQLKGIFAEANKKVLDVKNNKAMSETEKYAAKKNIVRDKQVKLANLMGGNDNLKKFYQVRKKQKSEL